MKTSAKRLTLAIGLATLLVLPTFLLAAGPGLFGQHGIGKMGDGLGMEMGLGGMIGDRIAARLDLTEQQRQDIRAILIDSREDFQPAMDTLIAARVELGDAIHAEVYDERAVRDASAGVAAAQAELAVMRAEVIQDVRTVLTPEQQEEAARLREDLQAMAAFKIELVRDRVDEALASFSN